MALSDLATDSIKRPAAAIRRNAISLAVAVAAAVGAIVYAASALLLLLEAGLGPTGARIAVAAALLAIAIAAYFAPRMFGTPPRRAASAASPEMEDLPRDQRIAMVLEALLLGFSMGARKPSESTEGRR